jgi:hypothetical protein
LEGNGNLKASLFKVINMEHLQKKKKPKWSCASQLSAPLGGSHCVFFILFFFLISPLIIGRIMKVRPEFQ